MFTGSEPAATSVNYQTMSERPARESISSQAKVEDIHIPPTSRAQCDTLQIGLMPLN